MANSSDSELNPVQKRPSNPLSSRSGLAFLNEHAERDGELRMKSKARVRGLELTVGSPAYQAKVDGWLRAWDAFVARQRAKSVPYPAFRIFLTLIIIVARLQAAPPYPSMVVQRSNSFSYFLIRPSIS